MKYKRWDFWHAQTHTVAGHIRGGFVCVESDEKGLSFNGPKKDRFSFYQFLHGCRHAGNSKKGSPTKSDSGISGWEASFSSEGKIASFFPSLFQEIKS